MLCCVSLLTPLHTCIFALAQLSSAVSRVAVIHNAADVPVESALSDLPALVAAVLRTHSPDPAMKTLGTLFADVLNNKGTTADTLLTSAVKSKKQAKVRAAMTQGDTVSLLQGMRRVAQRALGLPPGAAAVVANGRLYGPLQLGGSVAFTADDMKLLEGHLLGEGKSKTLARMLQYASLVGVSADEDTPALRSLLVANVAMVCCV